MRHHTGPPNRWLAVLILGIALLVVACGGDGDGTAMPAASTDSATRTRAKPNATATETAMPTASPTATSIAFEPETSDDSELSFPATEPAASAALLFDRKIVAEAAMQLKVDNVREKFATISLIAGAEGGFVAESSLGTEKDYEVATIVVRVPVQRFQDVLARVRALAIAVIHEQASARDVTQEYVDQESRLRNLEAVEQQYLTLLGSAEQVKDILAVQDRLNRTRGEIEQTRGRLNVLDDLTQLATLTVNLRPEEAFAKEEKEPGPESSIEDTARDAWDSSVGVLRGAARVIVAVAVFSWWLALPGAVGLAAWWRWSALRDRRAGQGPAG